jgi:MFS family permease
MLLYAVLIQLDSAALTAGAVTVAEKGRKGATLGLHSLIGFGGAAAGPLVVGLMLDIGGGSNSVQAWGLGFASMGFVALLGPIGLWWYREK